MRLLAILTVLWIFVPIEVRADALSDCAEEVAYGAPSDGPVLLCRLTYLVAYDAQTKDPDWVAYHLLAGRLDGPVHRTDDFRPDPDLPLGGRAELSDYRGSGYDRGHMLPAADNKWSEKAMHESFLLSNISPQVGNGFNRGIWAKLEALVRDWTRQRGELYVVTGPVFVGPPLAYIGPDRVAVPTHFFKVIFDPVRAQAIAFLLPNTSLPTSTLPAYVTSVRHIEELTGLDFLSRLDDRVEAVVETSVSHMW